MSAPAALPATITGVAFPVLVAGSPIDQPPNVPRDADDATRRHGQPIVVDGETLSIPAVAAVARYGASVVLDDSVDIQTRVLKSRQVIVDKVNSQKSVYGVSTGFGGSGERGRTRPRGA